MAGLDPELVRRRLDEVRARIGPDVDVLVAVKYLEAEDLGALRAAGVTLVGENRAQALERKAALHPELVWDFIGHLQSRKVKAVLPLVRWIHSVGSDSAIAALARHAEPTTEVMLEVNVAREPGKSGFTPEQLPAALASLPCVAVGLMTMPPLASDPEQSRRWFAATAELAAAHGLAQLSMGTSQDYEVAAQEGATIVRLGSRLLS